MNLEELSFEISVSTDKAMRQLEALAEEIKEVIRIADEYDESSLGGTGKPRAMKMRLPTGYSNLVSGPETYGAHAVEMAIPIGWIAKAAELLGGILLDRFVNGAMDTINAGLEAEQAAKEAKINERKGYRGQLAGIQERVNSYIELTKKQRLSQDEMKKMSELETELVEKYGLSTRAIDGKRVSTQELMRQTQEYMQTEAKNKKYELQNAERDSYQKANILFDNTDYELTSIGSEALVKANDELDELEKERDKIQRKADEATSRAARATTEAARIEAEAEAQTHLDDLNKKNIKIQEKTNWIGEFQVQYAEASTNLVTATEEYTTWFNDYLDNQANATMEAGQYFNASLADSIASMYTIRPEAFQSKEELKNFVENSAQEIIAICSDEKVKQIYDGLRGFEENMMRGIYPNEEEWGLIEEWRGYLLDTVGPAIANSAMGMNDGVKQSMIAARWGQFLPLDIVTNDVDRLKTILAPDTEFMKRYMEQYQGMEEYFLTLYGAEKDLWKQQKLTTDSTKTMANGYGNASKQIAGATESQSVFNKVQGQAIPILGGLNAGIAEYTATLSANGQKWGVVARAGMSDVRNYGNAVTETGKIVRAFNGDILKMSKTRAGWKFEQAALKDIFPSQPKDEDIPQKPRSSSRNAAAAAEEAARRAEEARKEAIRKDYETIDHKRHLNEITLEEELALLEKIRVNHQLNAEEIMDWERKIFDLKKELRERDEESIEKLGDSVVDALEARYEAMRDAELDRLDESRKAWEQWRDDSVKAIEDQIAALDKLADTEDREKKDAEELRKIAKIKQEIEFERDDYNRAKLQQQLDTAIAAREERLRRLELEDQKEALREQIAGIEEKADAELELLDKEEEKIDAAYEERLKEAALRAEAEKLILTKSQDELLALLKEYAPEYDALGKTMGEKLVDGFEKKVVDIAEWFENFNNAMIHFQDQFAQDIINTMDNFQQQHSQRQNTPAPTTPPPTVVHQTIQFYEPVETPSQVARRIEQVNQELAVLLA